MREERKVLVRDARAPGELGFALAALEEVRARTKRAVEGLSTPRLAAKTPGANSIGTLVRHIALIELDWILTDVGRGEGLPDGTPPMLMLEDPMADPGPLPLEDFLAALDFAREVTVNRLSRLPAGEPSEEREYFGDDVHRTFNVRWILHHLVVHEAHHLGQIASARAQSARDVG
jgi:uncharacterized damage-inducible protein DinB